MANRILILLLLNTALLSAQSVPGRVQWNTTISSAAPEIVKLDAQGHIFVAGIAYFEGFPVTPNAFAPNPPDLFHTEGFLLELDASGTTLMYSTFLGGINPKDFVVDGAGCIYVIADHLEVDPLQLLLAGRTLSWPIQISAGAAQTTPGVGSTPVLMKIAPSGELVYSTFFGGLSAVSGGLAVNTSGAAVVCGTTGDPSLPVSAGAFQSGLVADGNAFVARISPDGSAFEALTYFGGTGVTNCRDLKLDADGNVVLYGDTDSQTLPITLGAYQSTERGQENLFVAKLDPDLQHLIWSTYVGSSGTDVATALRVAPNGTFFLTGTTKSMDFPAPPDTAPSYLLYPPLHQLANRPFVARLDPSAAQLLSAYVMPFDGVWLGLSDVGDSLYGACSAVVADIIQNTTLNAAELLDVPWLNAPSPTFNPNYPYSVLLRFDSSLEAPTYIGPLNGFGDLPTGLSANSSGALLVASQGNLFASGVPVRQIGPSTGSSLVSLDFSPSAEPAPSITQVTNPASLLAGPVSPGQLIEIRGFAWTAASHAQVFMDGQSVPVLSSEADRILVIAPTTVGATLNLSVQIDGAPSSTRTIATTAVNPALFTAAGMGSGPALAFNPDGTSNAPGHPVGKGSSVIIIATGLGAADTSGQPVAQITAQIDGFAADVLSVGPAPAYPPGYYAIQVVVPDTVGGGDFVPLQIQVGGTSSQPGVTVAVR